MDPVRLAVLGAGLIGRRHAECIGQEDCAELTAVVDPSGAGRTLAAEHGVRWFPDFAALIAHERPDGLVIATPNQVHVRNGLEAVAARIPALVEKPLADDLAEAARLVDAAEAAGVPLMTGHHRRHNPLIQEAKRAVDSGRLGRVVAVHAQCWFHKPLGYFDAPWRRQKGAGPLFVNLVHDLDLLRHLCGEVAEVQAMESNALRGYEVEDTATVLLRFENGALGTLSVSDTVSAPWSWEMTSGENPAYTHTDQFCCLIGGTFASLAVPGLDVWFHAGSAPDWWAPMKHERLFAEAADPLRLQIRNLCHVVRGTAAPVVSGREGLQTLRLVEAAKRAAAAGQAVRLN